MTVKQNKLSTGFTLLEVLIAMLIISIGLLGVATLQIRGQQFNQVSYFRTQATFLAYDLMDRIRVNFAINRGNMANYDILEFTHIGPSGEIEAPITTCDNGSCNSAALRNYDLNNWFFYLRDTLPSGQAQIIPNAVNNYTITIRWKDIVDDKDDDPEQQTWVLQL